MAFKRRILCPLSVVIIIVAFLQASGTTLLQSSETASSSDLILLVQTESLFYGSGEVVKLIGNLTDMNGTAIQGAKIAVEVRNPRNNTIFIDIVFTSIDGTFEDSFRLDKNAILGDYYVYGTANAVGYPATNSQTIFIVVTVANLSEKNFIASDLNETILLQNGTISNAEVQGDLSGALNFTSFEMVKITTGPFAGKGFSKGTWGATLEGISYRGEWRGAFYFTSFERKIYMKGEVSGEMTGVVEGYLSESLAQSGVYDRYLATWRIGRLHTTVFSATLSLNGTLVYDGYSEFPFIGLDVLQTSIEGSASGHYNCSLSSTLTQIRVSAYSPFIGEGFSIISYSSNYGMGEGWTCDRLASPGIVEMKGFLTSPLYGVVYATLNETTLPRNLHMYIERVDLGLPPMADLKLKVWGSERVSPGQTITYAIELRNDGFKSAENITLSNELPWAVNYLSSTGEGVYGKHFKEVDWNLSLPAKSKVELTTQGKVLWGLSQGTILGGFVKILEEIGIDTDPSIETKFEIVESNESYSKVKYSVSNQSMTVSMDGEISITEGFPMMSPTIEVRQVVEGMNEVVCSFMVGESLALVSLLFPENIGATAKTVDFVRSYQGYIDETIKFETNEDLTNDLYTKGYEGMKISEDTWERLHAINEGEFILKTFFKGLAKIVPGFGSAVSKLSYDIPISSITSYYRCIAIAVENPDLCLALREKYELRSQVVVARDPNVKYGFEGYVSQGQTMNYAIECENEGEGIAYGVHITDTLDEDLDDLMLEIGPVTSTINGSVIAGQGTYNPLTRTITWLVGEVGPNEGGIANFSVKVRNDAPQGTEIINSATVYFPSVPETTRTNSIVSVVGQPNIAVKDLTPLETPAKIGSILYLNATIANEGYFAETVNITLYANSTTISTENITLTGRSENTVFFKWNTTNSLTGNYTISAYVWPVEGETSTADNTLSVWVPVTIQGDINGDFIVDIFDAIILAGAFNSGPGDHNWNPNADINSSGTVDIFDAIILAGHFNQHYP